MSSLLAKHNIRPVARTFRRRVTWLSVVYVCMYKHTRSMTRGAWGHAPPGKFLEIRCSEIASEAILGDRNRAVVATWLMENCIQVLTVHLCIC